ncbi:MAG: Quinate/shikimate dehydrogenase [Pelotomaculum sp. PtaU1.Bin065]|nr:MAG: Quinate/shikimate dehydrogenase [Pelotomaculum sp. PtaU1.Bin065]
MLTGISGRTKVCGIYGCPVEHSFSPVMHNAAFNALELDFVYVPFLVEPACLPAAVAAVRALGLAGVNVTIPHKQAVLPLLDEVTEEARLIGAVNTIVNKAGRLLGDNTDGRGFLRALLEQAGFNPAGKTALILGAGGAARAVAVQLVLAGARKVFLANRSRERAEALAGLLVENAGPAAAEVVAWPGSGKKPDPPETPPADLVVQTTPVEMYPNEGSSISLPFSSFSPGQVVCDLVYNPAETLFMKRAVQAGAVALNGLGMLLYQGVLSFEMWTGKAAPVEVMRESLLKCLQWRI